MKAKEWIKGGIVVISIVGAITWCSHEAQAIHVKTENIQHVMNEIRNDMSAIEWKMEASTQRISLIE